MPPPIRTVNARRAVMNVQPVDVARRAPSPLGYLFSGGRPSPHGVPALAGNATEGMRAGPGRTRNRLKPGLRAYSAAGTPNTYCVRRRLIKTLGYPRRSRAAATLPPIESRSERGVTRVYVASSFPSRQANRFVHAARTLKRPEGRAPGSVEMRARGTAGWKKPLEKGGGLCYRETVTSKHTHE